MLGGLMRRDAAPQDVSAERMAPGGYLRVGFLVAGVRGYLS